MASVRTVLSCCGAVTDEKRRAFAANYQWHATWCDLEKAVKVEGEGEISSWRRKDDGENRTEVLPREIIYGAAFMVRDCEIRNFYRIGEEGASAIVEADLCQNGDWSHRQKLRHMEA